MAERTLAQDSRKRIVLENTEGQFWQLRGHILNSCRLELIVSLFLTKRGIKYSFLPTMVTLKTGDSCLHHYLFDARGDLMHHFYLSHGKNNCDYSIERLKRYGHAIQRMLRGIQIPEGLANHSVVNSLINSAF
jgi:hypothetical protein